MSSIAPISMTAGQIYPEQDAARLRTPERLMAAMAGAMAPWSNPRWTKYAWIIDAVAVHAKTVSKWNAEQLLTESHRLSQRLRTDGFTPDGIGQAFAMVQEVSRRALGMCHRDVQLIGGVVMLAGMVAEMETGEGKTLTATLPACTLALCGIHVHIVTVNDYLAERDARWMGPIYEALGLKAGVITHAVAPADRRKAYRCHVTYCTNKELAFDYLRDRIVLWDRPSPMRMQMERLLGDKSRVRQLLLPGLFCAIVDEADSVLIDEARTPLIISSEGDNTYDPDLYATALDHAEQLEKGSDFRVSSSRHPELTERGKTKLGLLPWPDAASSLSRMHREELIRQALTAMHLFHRDVHYLVQEQKVQIIDEYTGRLMADRSWEKGLHQLIELKEGCPVTLQKETRARISYQRFFRRYLRLAGMTGTALEVSGELRSVYGLKVVRVPPYRPLQRKRLPDRIFPTAHAKWQAVMKTVARHHGSGRPVLVGTRSVEASEHLSSLMTVAGLPHRVLNARQDRSEAEIIAQAGESGRITVATNMAGRGTDIHLGPGVTNLGGLQVIATERHDARRIDRQLFGRCGRQGDPGCAAMFVSLEDDLVKNYGGKILLFATRLSMRLPMMGRIGLLVGKLLYYRSQCAAGRLHSQMRRNLLKLDEQISTSLAFTGRTE